MPLTIHIDGGSRGNPGPAAAAVVIERDGVAVFEAGYFLGRQTNNAAEYQALVLALKWAIANAESDIAVFSDSELLVRQIRGEYKVKNAGLEPLYREAQALLLKVDNWTLQHVPRERNRRADALVNQTLDRGADTVETDRHNRGIRPFATPQPADAAPGQPNTAASLSHPTRTVRVTVTQSPAPEACPADGCGFGECEIGPALPAAICVHAAHALLPTVLAALATSSQEFSNIPPMTVRCKKSDCGATMKVEPGCGKNGRV
ncbi:MAG: Ribonuclease H [Phycisphaerae bacterium]|nr:Ribonuclease H [Phycisphaerae bacterium]